MLLPTNYNALSRYERRLVREEYVKRQAGRCHFCNMPLDGPPRIDVLEKPMTKWMFPEGFLDHPIHLHHSHEDGMTIGAVHAKCNAVLWEYFGE